MSLTPQQERFAQELASGKTQADAYRAAYPKSLKWKNNSVHIKASQLMAIDKVAIRVKELQDKSAEIACLNGAAIKEEIRRLAHSDIARIIDIKTGKVKLPHELDPETRAAISSFKIDEYGRIEYKFWDKNSALERAAKIQGLFEKDNEQKGNALAELLSGLSGKVLGKADAGSDD